MDTNFQTIHDDIHSKLAEIDAQLDSQIDTKVAGKRAIINAFIENSKDAWSGVASQLISELGGASEEVKIGIYYGLLRALNNEFSKPLAAAVDARVEVIPESPKVTISDDVLKELNAARSELYKKAKQLFEMNDDFGLGLEMKMPAKRTGAQGKRGARPITSFNWEIDGTNYDKLKDVAEVYDQYEKVSELTKAMREAGLDLKNPGDRLEFTMPDGKILIGTKDSEKVVSDEDPDGEEEEEEEVTS